MIWFFAAPSRFPGQSSSRSWCCLWKKYEMQSKRPHKRGRCTNSNSTCRTTCLVMSSESCNDHILLLWEVSCQVTIVANFLEVSWPRRRPLHCRTHRKFITVNFFRFFSCHICRTTVCWDPDILLPWQTWQVPSKKSIHIELLSFNNSNALSFQLLYCHGL